MTPVRPANLAYGVSAQLRWVSIPSWLLNAFTKQNVPLSSWGTGLSVFRRKGNFDIALSFNYQNMSPPAGNWLGSSDKAMTDVSYLQFQSFALYGFDFSFLWHNYFTDWFGIHYGAGVGIGILGGHIDRTKNLAGCTDANVGDTSMCMPGPDSTTTKLADVPPGRPHLQRPAGRRLPRPEAARLGGPARRRLLRCLLSGRRHRIHVLAVGPAGVASSVSRQESTASANRRRNPDPVRHRPARGLVNPPAKSCSIRGSSRTNFACCTGVNTLRTSLIRSSCRARCAARFASSLFSVAVRRASSGCAASVASRRSRMMTCRSAAIAISRSS